MNIFTFIYRAADSQTEPVCLPSFWQVAGRLRGPCYFFVWGISKPNAEIPHEKKVVEFSSKF
jgi:hypothetical protein